MKGDGSVIQIIKLCPNDRIKLKKAHPCGGSFFRILRVGSEVRILCETCKRDMTMDRIKLEKAIKTHIPANETTEANENGKGTDAKA